MSLPSLSIVVVRKHLRAEGITDESSVTEITDAVFAYVRNARPGWDDDHILDATDDLTLRLLRHGI